MFGRTVGVVAVLAVGASAFLLPPGVQSFDAPGASALAIDPKSQAIKLPCSSCVFPSKEEKLTETEEGDGLFWAQGGASDVILNFTVSEDDRSVNLNGWQLYPLTMDNPETPTLDQVAASNSLVEVMEHPELKTRLDVSGASIAVDEEIISPAGDKIVRLVYHVLSIEEQPMTLDGAELKLLENAEGSLMIISVESIDKSQDMFDLSPPPPFGRVAPINRHGKHPEKECTMPAAICKLKAMVESKMGGFRQGPPHKAGGCGRHKGPHRRPGHNTKPDDANEEHPDHHHARPDRPHRGHGGHGMHRGPHHRHHHGFLYKVPRAFLLVFVPIIAGITTGMFVCLLGMLAGRVIAFIWINLVRGGKRGYASVTQIDADEAVMEKGAIEEEEEEESLPQYEDAPAYETEEQK